MIQYQKEIINERGEFKIREIVDGKFYRYVLKGTVYSKDTKISSLDLNPCIIEAFNSGNILEEIKFELVEPKIEEIVNEETNKSNFETIDDVVFQAHHLLRTTDFTQLPDTPITDEQKSQFASYRKELRNLKNIKNVKDVVWPEPPIPIDDLMGI